MFRYTALDVCMTLLFQLSTLVGGSGLKHDIIFTSRPGNPEFYSMAVEITWTLEGEETVKAMND